MNDARPVDSGEPEGDPVAAAVAATDSGSEIVVALFSPQPKCPEECGL